MRSRGVLAAVTLVLSGALSFSPLAWPAHTQAPAAAAPAGPATMLYKAIQDFSLKGGSVRVDALTLKRDRVLMSFTGTFYFALPVDGRVTGAVFIGQGTVRADVPPIESERDHVRRLLKADVVESDFKTAVLRFSDDTFDVIGKGAAPGEPAPEATRLAAAFEAGMLKETGANIAARLTTSILNGEAPGVFVAQFDKGKRDRFSCLFDAQGRIPVAHFGLNGGEKGVVFAYNPDYFSTEVWMAFYSLDDLKRGIVPYSDASNLVETRHCAMDVDVRDPARVLRLKSRMDLTALTAGVRAIPFSQGENLSVAREDRLKLAMRLKSAVAAGGEPIEAVQEPWEAGFTLFLPAAVQQGQRFTVEVQTDGDFMRDIDNVVGNHYPLSNTAWYPRHGYLGRSTFDLVFHHPRNTKIASVGVRVREEPNPQARTEMITQFALDVPVAIVSFAMGPFQVYTAAGEKLKGASVPIEFYSMPDAIVAVRQGFVLAEMTNSLNYFSSLFGAYPYPAFRAALHPFGFGQGLPTLLMLPPADLAGKETYSFIAHETSHQWWGDKVLWRSYRDQWLSEGFARYSGLLYTGRRDKPESVREMLKIMRDSLTGPPRTALGVGKGRLTDVGPLIMGHRLGTRETANAYSALIYDKGGLVLRMLHFLFTDAASGNGQPFFDMMADFVRRFENRSASTDDFMAVADEHFTQTTMARRFGITSLRWFFNQWIYQTYLPSYRMEYAFEAQADGSLLLKGSVFQDGIPPGEDWFMPLPLVLRFGKDQVGRSLVQARGPETPFSFRVPAKPQSVELDPDLWVLSEKTTARMVKAK